MTDDGREFKPNRSGQVDFMMTRCSVCQRWWTSLVEDRKCGCGGELVGVDFTAHLASLPKHGVTMPERDIPRDHKLLALSLLTRAQLMDTLKNPGVSEQAKDEVREEIGRRDARK